MGIDGMTKRELSESIPPAHRRFVGGILLLGLASDASS